MKLRQRIARKLISFGIRLHGEFDATEPSKPIPLVPVTKVSSGGAVVEETTDAVRWSPEQHGNVVIAEPDIMTRFRREKHDDDM